MKSKLLMNGHSNESMNQGGFLFYAHHYRLDTFIAKPVIKEVPTEGLYKIGLSAMNFPINYTGYRLAANCSTLLFMHPGAKQPEQYNDGIYYDCSFTPNYLEKKAAELSRIMNLFNPVMATAFLVSRTQKLRIEAIFETMIEESFVNQPFKNEMLQNLITEIAIFTQRLIPVELVS